MLHESHRCETDHYSHHSIKFWYLRCHHVKSSRAHRVTDIHVQCLRCLVHNLLDHRGYIVYTQFVKTVSYTSREDITSTSCSMIMQNRSIDDRYQSDTNRAIFFSITIIASSQREYLKSQNFESDGDKETCALEYVLPRKLPNQTSYPRSAKRYANIHKRHIIFLIFLNFITRY
jgi:hypothetical protein